ncbi:DNA replication complex GINS protein PSF3 [Saccoglossus kowalevskii]|uniref:DNA replication complex GINS protein PSF3 n=1 Tax=Saccoglossus kowalevskii TaxID=10224 RepID=A0ABM0GGU2_SACKO|nr:DNA replication complex GINS protein PSF3 [Saccoglossus kowalevskii]
MSLVEIPYTRYSSSSDNYYCIDDIIATCEKIPSKVEQPLFRLGFLDPSTDNTTIQPGTKLELPFWLASSLCTRRRRLVSVDMPKTYKDSFREILKADANVVDLHKIGPYYYSFGSKLLHFDHPEIGDIADSLLQGFISRFRRIMDSSQNAYNEDTTHLTCKLDESERCVFKAGQKGLDDFQRWQTGQTTKINTSQMVANHRKRKRVVMEED